MADTLALFDGGGSSNLSLGGGGLKDPFEGVRPILSHSRYSVHVFLCLYKLEAHPHVYSHTQLYGFSPV